MVGNNTIIFGMDNDHGQWKHGNTRGNQVLLCLKSTVTRLHFIIGKVEFDRGQCVDGSLHEVGIDSQQLESRTRNNDPTDTRTYGSYWVGDQTLEHVVERGFEYESFGLLQFH